MPDNKRNSRRNSFAVSEWRYIIPSLKEFVKLIAPFFERSTVWKDEYGCAVYFENDDHITQFDRTIKAQQYTNDSINLPLLDNTHYVLSVKGGLRRETDKALQGTLEELTDVVNQKYKFPASVRPYVAVTYSRQSYSSKGDNNNICFSIDTHMRYFFFHENHTQSIEIGREEYPRVEIKENVAKQLRERIEDILTAAGAFPLISKQATAYGLLTKFLKTTYGKSFYKELKECEIESKLEAESEDVLYEIKEFFKHHSLPYALPTHFPYTFETASINRYYEGKQGHFKALIKGDRARLITKGEKEIVQDPFNFSCILKRKEVKGDRISLWSEFFTSAKLKGELLRQRKAFWLENPQSRRFYHISLDRSSRPGKVMYQLEIEYTGRYGIASGKQSKGAEKEIIRDIAELTKIVLEKFPKLKPSQLTKKEWLDFDIL